MGRSALFDDLNRDLFIVLKDRLHFGKERIERIPVAGLVSFHIQRRICVGHCSKSIGLATRSFFEGKTVLLC